MISIHQIQSGLNELADKLAIFLPLANCHMVDFITFNLWDKVLPCTLMDDLENIAIEDLYKVMFPQEEPLDYHLQGIQGQFPHLHEFISAVHTLQLSQLGVLSTKLQVYEWLELQAEREVERVSLGRLMRHQKMHEVEEMSQLIATLCQELQLSWVCDLGAGKGYLSSVLARHYKLNVLAVDCVLSNVTAAQSYQKILQRELNHQEKLKTKKNSNKTVGKDHQLRGIQEQDTSFYRPEAAQVCSNDSGATGPRSLNEVLQGISNQVKSGPQDLEQDALSQARLGSLEEGTLVEGVGGSKTLPGPALNIDEAIPNAGVRNLAMNGGLGSCQPGHITFNCDLLSCPLKQCTELLGLYLCVTQYISTDVQLLEVLHEAIHFHCSSSANSVSSVSSSQASGTNPVSSVFSTSSSGTNPVSSTSIMQSTGANLVSSACSTSPLTIPAPRLLVSGLHSCGDLACAGVKAFSRDTAVGALCVVGCCYHLITEAFDREGIDGVNDRHRMRIADDSKIGHGGDNDGDCQGNGSSLDNTNDCKKGYGEIEHQTKFIGTDKCLKMCSKKDARKQEAVTAAFTSQYLEEDTVGVKKIRQQSPEAASLGNPGPASFPMSACLVKKQYSLGRNARMIAAQPPARLSHSTSIDSSRSQFWRALLQLVIVSRLHEAASRGGCQEEPDEELTNQPTTTISEEQHVSSDGTEGHVTGEACMSSEMSSVYQQSELESDTRRSKLLDHTVKCHCTVSNGNSSHCRPIDFSKKSETSGGIEVKPSCEHLYDTKISSIETPQFNAVFSAMDAPLTDGMDQAKHISERYASASFFANNSLPQNSPLSTHQLPTTTLITSDTLSERKPQASSLDAAHLDQPLRCPQSSTATGTAASLTDNSTCLPLRGHHSSIVPKTLSSPQDYTAFQLCGCPAHAADRESLTAYRVGRRLAGRCTSFEEYAAKAIVKLPAALRSRVQVSREELRSLERCHHGDRDRLAKLFLLRASLGPVIEGLVLLDRLAFLVEQDCCRAAFLLPLFDPVLSPRCFALLAFKNAA